jgi:hypothetical protein
MQGYTACQVKPALFQSDQPKFWAGPVEAAAFLERGGVVIFIFFSGDKPGKYTDPDGRADEDSNDGEDIQIDPPGRGPNKITWRRSGSIATYFIAKKVIGTIMVFIPEPITTGIGVGLLVTP